MIACAILFGYGATVDLTAKVHLRLHGVKVLGNITEYRAHLTGEYPVVTFQTYHGVIIKEASSEKFFSWAAPAVGSVVDVYYDRDQPAHFHLFFNRGLIQFAWLELPAALAFLFTFLLVTGLRFVLI